MITMLHDEVTKQEVELKDRIGIVEERLAEAYDNVNQLEEELCDLNSQLDALFNNQQEV